MLENHSTQTALSSQAGCSQLGHNIVNLAVKKNKIFVNSLLLTSHLYMYTAVYLLNNIYM